MLTNKIITENVLVCNFIKRNPACLLKLVLFSYVSSSYNLTFLSEEYEKTGTSLFIIGGL